MFCNFLRSSIYKCKQGILDPWLTNNVFLWYIELDKTDVKPNLYSYSELKAATQEFHPNNELGRGGFGVVYKVGINSSFDSLPIPIRKGNTSFVR